MFYRVILDCRPAGPTAARPFITVKFVNAETESSARLRAVARTKALMKVKGFEDVEIAAFKFVAEEIERFDTDDAELDAEQAFAYYSDD